jgi:Sec-independent protein translocase protein TatA
MDSLEELTKSNGKTGFFKHVFNFDDESKVDILNIIQYSVLAILPLVLFNKSLQKLVPEANDEKHSIELSMEVIAQVIVAFLGMLIIHRIITFIPTYSGAKYVDFNVTNIVLSVLIILLSLQTKLGEKISILADRVVELWNGTGNHKKKKNKNTQQQQQQQQQQPNDQAISQSLDSTQINSLPAQQQSNFNQMYQIDNTPLIGASTPGSDMVMEPMAANSMGGAFGSLF